MAEINLLHRYPRAKRNIEKRTGAQSEENIRIAQRYGREYFDGSRDTGYGGYRYDGRWVPIAEDMIAHVDLRPGDRVLDVGAGKGFLVKDFMKACPGVNAGEKMHRQAGVKMHQWMQQWARLSPGTPLSSSIIEPVFPSRPGEPLAPVG